MKRLDVLTELAAELAFAELEDEAAAAEPWKASAVRVLTEAQVRLFGRPSRGRGLVNYFEQAQAVGAWFSGLVFYPDPSSAECPEA